MEVRVSATTAPAAESGADTVVVGLVEGEGVPHDVDGAMGALLESGEARTAFRHLAHVHAAGKRWILVGLGARDELTFERLKTAAAVAQGRAAELGARRVCFELPHRFDGHPARAVVEGVLGAAYRFDRYRSSTDERPRLEELVLSDHHDRSESAARAAAIAAARWAMRDLQNAPANELTPAALAGHAEALADSIPGLSCEQTGRDGIVGAGMNAFAAVAQGSDQDPRLIVMRWEPEGARGPVLGLVGKAVTFDTGGISIKPGQKMEEMKFDMSGGAAVIEAVGAIARLGLPVRVVAVVGATENMPGGDAVKPGDIVRALNGTTIEINNTDAEGRLVLADCLAHAVALGAERLVDVATLTGGIIVAFGSVHAGLFADDDAWAAEVQAASQLSGDRVWRLPLDPDYAAMIKGRYADIVNTTGERKALSIAAAEFLARFTGGVPWAHLDIAGVANDIGKPYAVHGGSGFGVGLLVELAAALSAS